MTEPRDLDEHDDQDAEPTMTAPPGDRPDAGASTMGGSSRGRGDSPDVVDTDDEQESESGG